MPATTRAIFLLILCGLSAFIHQPLVLATTPAARESAPTGPQNESKGTSLTLFPPDKKEPSPIDTTFAGAPPTLQSASVCSTLSDVWQNGAYNTVNGLGSSDIPDFNTRTADDFVFTQTTVVSRVTADFLVTPGTYSGKLDILLTDASGEGPSNTAPPIVSVSTTLFQRIGTQFNSEIRRYFFFGPNLTFEPGRYWVSPYLTGSTGQAFLGTSNGAQPSAEQFGYFKSADFGFPTWTRTFSGQLAGIGPNFAFSVNGCLAAGSPQDQGTQVSLSLAQAGLNGTTPLVCTLPPRSYIATPYTISATLTNIGRNTFTNPFFQVAELSEAAPPTPAVPFRLATATDFNPNNCTGGSIGAIQPIAPSMAPGGSQPVTFQVLLPAARAFRFFVNVGATVSVAGGIRLTTPRPAKLGTIAFEVTFDRFNRPRVSTMFLAAKDAPPSFKLGAVTARLVQ